MEEIELYWSTCPGCDPAVTIDRPINIPEEKGTYMKLRIW